MSDLNLTETAPTRKKSQLVERITYSIDRRSGTAHRHDRGTGFWQSGFLQAQRILVQDANQETFVGDVAHAITQDLEKTYPSDLGQFPDHLHAFEKVLAQRIRRRLSRSDYYELRWTQCLSLLERTVPAVPVQLGPLLLRIRRFERELAKASTGLPSGSGNPTAGWDVEDMALALLSRRRYPPARVGKFATDLMDLKFKVFCITCVDLPTYSVQVRSVGVETVPGRLLALSFDAAVAFKCRALWETAMNLIYHLETGNDAEDLGKKKSAKWWEWVRTQRRWRGLARFHRLVERHDAMLRTPEAHKSSRLRAVFTSNRSPRRHRVLANQLLNQSIGIWDHLSFVVSLNKGVTYQKERQVLKPL